MIQLDIPGRDPLQIHHIVLDYNGTLAAGGILLDGLPGLLGQLAGLVDLHVVTADTFGQARSQLAGLPCLLTVLPDGDQAEAKRDYVRKLGPERCVALGNGRNDRLMLREAGIGIALIQAEGAAAVILQEADIVCRDAGDALSLFIQPGRLVATLRA